MEANVERYLEEIQGYTHEQLLRECADLKRKNDDLNVQQIEYRKASTAMSKAYKQMSDRNKELQAENTELKKLCNTLREQNQMLNRYRFGSHNEKLDALSTMDQDWQDPLSEDAESIQSAEDIGDIAEAKLHADALEAGQSHSVREAFGKARTKVLPTRRDFSALPHTDSFNMDPDQLDKDYGDGNWQIVGWHRKELLHRVPCFYYVEQRHTPVVKDMDANQLIACPMPDVFYPGSPATASVVAGIMYDSTILAIPYFRQEMDMANHGLILPRQDMANWVIRFAYSHLSVAYEYMHYLLTTCHYGQCDETWIQVLHEDGRKATSKSYVWVHTTGELDNVPPVVVFAYEPTRAAEHLHQFYSGFSGALSSDAYSAYPTFAKASDGAVVSCGCFMHARRRFFEAFLTACSAKMTDEQRELLVEHQAIRRISDIYKAEAKLKELTSEERLQRRNSALKPLIDEFFIFLRSLDIESPSMSDKLRDAIQYSLNHQEELSQFLHDGKIPIDNGYCENAIRMYARGRRNWLFCNSVSGAEAKMMIYSLAETAKRNKANPLMYLTYLLEKTPMYMDMPFRDERLKELMPWSDQYQIYQERQMQNLSGPGMPLPQPKPAYRRPRPTNSEPTSQMAI